MAGGPSPFSNSFSSSSVKSLRYNTSQQGSPIAICYGTQRGSVNLIEQFGFTGSGSKKGGGKGGASKSSKQTKNYSVNVDFALCVGPISFSGAPHGIGGSNRVWGNGGEAAASSLPLNYYTGEDGQAPDPVFASGGDPPALGYSGTAHVTATPMELGASPVLPNIQVEVSGFGAGTVGTSFPGDARPDWIVVDMMTNNRYGIGLAIAELDTAGAFDAGGSIADWGTYCQAALLAMSYWMDRQQPAARWIEEIVDQTSAAIFESGGVIKIVPYAETDESGNGASWSPDLAAKYDLTDSDFLDFGGGSDPVIVTRVDPAGIPNWINVEFDDGDNDFIRTTVPVFDQGEIDENGLNVEASYTTPGLLNYTSAKKSGQLRLDRGLHIRNTYKFKLGFRYSLLEQMDIITLTDQHIGLVQEKVRITQIEEDDNGELTITAEQLGLGAAPIYDRNASAGSAAFDPTVDPGDANTPVIFDPPPDLTGGLREAWIVATGGPNWGGCQVWISTDGTTYTQAGTILRGGRQGILTATLPSHSDPDTVNTLSVDMTESEGQLLSGTMADADNHVTLCYVGGELISYETATLTSAYHYDLTYLRRGAYGTTIASHSAGANFARVGPTDSSILRYQYPSNFIGQTIYVKLQSFNIFGGSIQDLSSVTAYTHTLTGAGAVTSTNVPIQYLGIPQIGSPIIRWTFAGAVSFPANLTGSVCTAGTAATGSTVFNIAKNGTNFGTMTFAAAGTSATFSAPATSFAAGDVLTITPTSTDATLKNLSGVLTGTS